MAVAAATTLADGSVARALARARASCCLCCADVYLIEVCVSLDCPGVCLFHGSLRGVVCRVGWGDPAASGSRVQSSRMGGLSRFLVPVVAAMHMTVSRHYVFHLQAQSARSLSCCPRLQYVLMVCIPHTSGTSSRSTPQRSLNQQLCVTTAAYFCCQPFLNVPPPVSPRPRFLPHAHAHAHPRLGGDRQDTSPARTTDTSPSFSGSLLCTWRWG